MLSTNLNARYLALGPGTIENVLTDCVMDLKEVVVLDGIDILPHGFRVPSHDLHGPLPVIVVENSGDTLLDKDQLSIAACKLISIVGLREEMIGFVAGGRFLPPTTMDGKAIVGMIKGRETWMAEGKDFLGAFHKLHDDIVG